MREARLPDGVTRETSRPSCQASSVAAPPTSTHHQWGAQVVPGDHRVLAALRARNALHAPLLVEVHRGVTTEQVSVHRAVQAQALRP